MLNLMCGASNERVAAVYPASATATASVVRPRVRGYGSQRPRYLSTNDGRQIVQCKLFRSLRRRIRPVHRKPVHREEGVDIAAGLR